MRLQGSIEMTQFVALSKVEHSNLKLGAATGLEEFVNLTTLPVYGAELSKLVLHYPLAFIQHGEQFGLHLLCSLSPQIPNVWITAEGKWIGGYLPATIRQRPFTLLPNEEGERVLCINQSSPMLGDEGEPLFSEGEPSKLLQGVLNFLNQLYQNGEITQRAIGLMREYELIPPWEIKLKGADDQEIPVKGIFRIDEAKLNQLEGEQLRTLQEGGALPLIYGQLFSMGNLDKLIQILKMRAQVSSSQAEAEEDLDAFFGEGEGDMLSFEGI